MNTTPSIWVVTWMMVASVTAVLVAFVQAFRHALIP
jgi:hypothetical protein